MDRAIALEGRADWTFQTLLGEMADFGDHPALIAVEGDAVTRWSFAELADRASRLASGLLRQGIAPGEAVLLMGKASPDWVVVRLALGAIGALTVACDHLATKDEVARLVRHSGCHRAFIAAEHVAMLRALDGGGRVALHLPIGRATSRESVCQYVS